MIKRYLVYDASEPRRWQPLGQIEVTIGKGLDSLIDGCTGVVGDLQMERKLQKLFGAGKDFRLVAKGEHYENS
jgi:hypothetical protein